ncbi:hypothetical protein Pmani_019092 [Petrolisthes manimaculis]|uniref:Malate dehydrogenase n=1 Tax=Petrolisthes manimaculis TaxID=1843537 RepID=A0AAE1PL61_9EUCA|nr:hypothetical protein Pmani_019092 [Petrolisthes manimaculis]
MDFIPEKSKFTPPEGLGTKVAVNEVLRFIEECMVASGASKPNAACLARVLVAADTRGHYSHGLQRLDLYVCEVKVNKSCDGEVQPILVKETDCTGLVDGRNGLGPVVSEYSMKLAITKAKNSGIGWVVARGSNHYGIAGYYSMKAVEEGLLGMSFTNACSGVAATRGKKGVVGTNPISVAAPGKGDDSFVLDMATSVVASGKVEVAEMKKESIPIGWGVDKNGEYTSSPWEVLHNEGWLSPLGGSELLSGHKGFGLGMMVEVFCGILSGGHYGQNIRDWRKTDREADVSHCFVAIDPQVFAPGFKDRMSGLMDQCRNLEPMDEGKPVLAAGDPERQHMSLVESQGGITYHINQIKQSWQLAQYLGVTPMTSV